MKDVIPDCKVKVYIKAKPVLNNPVVNNPTTVSLPQSIPVGQDKELVCKSPLLDLTNFKIPVIGM